MVDTYRRTCEAGKDGNNDQDDGGRGDQDQYEKNNCNDRDTRKKNIIGDNIKTSSDKRALEKKSEKRNGNKSIGNNNKGRGYKPCAEVPTPKPNFL